MAADPEMWKAFIEWCEREIAERRSQLVPLESGSMHTGRRGADTNFEWVDTTATDALRLRNEIASFETVIARNKHHVE